MISIVSSVTSNNVIGLNNNLVVHDSFDLFIFKQITQDKPVIMGRKTQESLPKGYLPNRTNIVVSSTKTDIPNCKVAPSLQEALNLVDTTNQDVFIIGGYSLFKEALDNKLVDRIYLTKFFLSKEGDTFFPTIPTKYSLVSNYDFYRPINGEYVLVNLETYKLDK